MVTFGPPWMGKWLTDSNDDNDGKYENDGENANNRNDSDYINDRNVWNYGMMKWRIWWNELC